MTTLADADLDQLRAAIEEARASGDLVALKEIDAALERALLWRPQEFQMPPPGDPDRPTPGTPAWWCWVARWGRGAGKSDTGSWYVDEHMKGPPCDKRVPGGHLAVIVGPTFDAAVAACVNAPAGILSHNPGVKFHGKAGGSVLTWPNGAESAVLGAHTREDAERLRSKGNRCLFWFDEAAIMVHLQLALDNVALGGRLGPHPHGIVTSTPKPTAAYQALLKLPDVVQTVHSTYENDFRPAFWDRIIARYEGSRLGLQELHAELLADLEGALWRRELIDADRVNVGRDGEQVLTDPDEILRRYGIVRVMVGVDPSTWDPELGDDPGTVAEGLETGIVIVGIDARREVFVLEDVSVRGSGETWAKAAAEAYHRWHAAYVVPETNAGGGLVLTTMRLVDPSVSIFRGPGGKPGVRAAQGKRARAEPVATLAEQHHLHHVGQLQHLENQQCMWDPREPWSPDRIDALVWGVTAIAPWAAVGGIAVSSGSRNVPQAPAPRQGSVPEPSGPRPRGGVVAAQRPIPRGPTEFD